MWSFLVVFKNKSGYWREMRNNCLFYSRITTSLLQLLYYDFLTTIYFIYLRIFSLLTSFLLWIPFHDSLLTTTVFFTTVTTFFLVISSLQHLYHDFPTTTSSLLPHHFSSSTFSNLTYEILFQYVYLPCMCHREFMMRS